MDYDNIRTTMILTYSNQDGNFRDEYYQDEHGNGYIASFYCGMDMPFTIQPADITGTIPDFGDF